MRKAGLLVGACEFNPILENSEFAQAHPEYRSIDFSRAFKTERGGGFAQGWQVDGPAARVFIKVFDDEALDDTDGGHGSSSAVIDEFALMCRLNSCEHVAHALAYGHFRAGEHERWHEAIVESYVDGDMLLAPGPTSFQDSAYYRVLTESRLMPTDPVPLMEGALAVARAVAELASANEAHRDLAPGNIIIGLDRRHEICAWIVDFGQSIHNGAGVTPVSAGPRLAQFRYGAPEMYPGCVNYAAWRDKLCVDVWSLGALLYLIFTGREPAVSAAVLNAVVVNNEVLRLVDEDKRRFSGSGLPEGSVRLLGPVGVQVSLLVSSCLSYDPSKRPSAQEVEDTLASCLRMLVTGDRERSDVTYDEDEATPVYEHQRGDLVGEALSSRFTPGHSPASDGLIGAWDGFEAGRPRASAPLVEAFATLYEDGTLEFRSDGSQDQVRPAVRSGRFDLEAPWWREEGFRDRVVRIVSDETFVAPRSLLRLFKDCRFLVDLTGLASWDVSLVEDLSSMFWGCSSLADVSKRPGPASWNVSSVTKMSYLFCDCTALTGIDGLSSWGKARPTDLRHLFDGCWSLPDASALTTWDVSHTRKMDSLFKNCVALHDISGLTRWNVSSLRTMRSLFAGCRSLSDLSPLRAWNVSGVRETEWAFAHCASLTDVLPLARWDVSKVEDLNNMFCDCPALRDLKPLDSWNLAAVEDMKDAFDGTPGQPPSWYRRGF